MKKLFSVISFFALLIAALPTHANKPSTLRKRVSVVEVLPVSDAINAILKMSSSDIFALHEIVFPRAREIIDDAVAYAISMKSIDEALRKKRFKSKIIGKVLLALRFAKSEEKEAIRAAIQGSKNEYSVDLSLAEGLTVLFLFSVSLMHVYTKTAEHMAKIDVQRASLA